MAVTVASVIAEARRLLQDGGATQRYTDGQLIAALNEGQNAIVRLDNSAKTMLEDRATVTGVRQTLPDTAVAFMRVHCNIAASAPTNAVTSTTVSELDTALSTWRAAVGARVLQAAPDEFDPLAFYIYPALASGSIRVQYAVLPTPAISGGNITLPDRFALGVTHFVVYKMFEADSDNANNAAMATKHQQQFFATVLGPKALQPPRGSA